MDTITYSEARSKLADTMEKVCDDHAPIIITRKSSRSVVMISLDDYQALEEDFDNISFSYDGMRVTV